VRVFGLTGGLGSGKSTVAALFRQWGVPVVDADAIAREVVAAGSPGLTELVAAFGPDILNPAGELDRKALARRAFATPEGRAKLGAITHPKIGARSQERFHELGAQGEPLVAYEAALLVENGLADAFRPLVVVAAPPELQRARAIARDAEPAAEVEARLAAQMPLERKVAAADYVIENTGTLEALAQRASDVLGAICAELGIDRARYASGSPLPGVGGFAP
jgi:dephospho-CoA kinase